MIIENEKVLKVIIGHAQKLPLRKISIQVYDGISCIIIIKNNLNIILRKIILIYYIFKLINKVENLK